MDHQDSIYSLPDSDLDLSFTSVATSSSDPTLSARTSLALSLTSPRPSSSPHPRPHRRHNNPNWDAINAATTLSSLHLHHLRLLRPLGAGDLGRVFLCRLRDYDSASFALKVVDRDALCPKKLTHVHTEAQILSTLDHPFLPTLYAHIDVSHYTCLLIDYCPNGDLHSLLQKQPSNRLPIQTARFFAAEVLLALEYLHAKGIVYRDLKPENILIQENGHVMLSDFDLCFYSDVSPELNCRDERLVDREKVSVEFVAEPKGALSRSCVGTHEYLAPEMVSGDGHGCGVDWWAFGVLLYELLYGTTPFKGRSKEATLRNIARGVRFRPPPPAAAAAGMAEARDLIGKLLVKDVRRRMGCDGGATEIKRHVFFSGIKWPLIRSYRPPEIRGMAVRRGKSGAEVGGLRRGVWRRVRSLMRIKGSKNRLNDNQNYYSYVNYRV